jgi:hypothetical protein
LKKKPPFPSKVLYGTLGIIFILLILHIGSYLHLLQNNLNPESFFFRKTNFDSERNLPAIFSGILHIAASYSLAMVAISQLNFKNSKSMWWVLSFIFFFLGVDEILVLHEKIEGNLAGFEENGVFFYNWIVLYGSGILILGAFMAKSLWSLPRKTLYLFITAGIIFVLGAIVLESIAGNLVFQRQLNPEVVKITPAVFILATLEELFEMLGVTIFIFAILDFLYRYRVPKTEKEVKNF